MATKEEARQIALDALVEIVTKKKEESYVNPHGLRLEAIREIMKHTFTAWEMS